MFKLLAKSGLRLFAFGDVLCRCHPVDRVAIGVAHARHVHLDRKDGAIGPNHAAFVTNQASAVCLHNVLSKPFMILRHIEVSDLLSADFLNGATEHPREGGVTGHDAIRARHTEGDAMRAVLKGVRPLAQFRLRPLLFGDVHQRALHARYVPVGVGERPGIVEHRNHRAILAAQVVLEIAKPSAGEQLPVCRQDRLGIGIDVGYALPQEFFPRITQ